ncbi:MAG TPA: HEAT repeat domain-containing protein, partial [Kofleriaceae bacterium]|nr:HEAT repeat domain-containing protein [Kofleriaceae bacterium]
DALDRAAVAELGRLSSSSSPRMKRLAAQALARTGDPAALAALRGLLGEEQSQLGRIQIAYSLARAGDKAALEELKKQLGAERRDVRLDAARALVQLGDDSGRKTLRAMLPLDNYRLGAAGLLARLKDEEGIKALRGEMSKKTSAENVMRAVVALGRAGQSDVQDQLRSIVHDRRYNVGAADALAALGDAAAVEPLTRQLGLSAMRVQAALWLRRLNQKVDLAPLALALETGDDAARVSAAEALLVLTGPPTLAERD